MQIYFWNMIEEAILRNCLKHIRKYVFGNRVIDKWNNLPQCCVNCTTLNNFKSHIHKVLEPETE